MDSNGYPDEAELKQIREWPWQDFDGLMEFVKDLWRYPERFKRTGNDYYLSTGGWSGNESLIEALQLNLMFWGCCWEKSERGGHFYFTIRECNKQEQSK